MKRHLSWMVLAFILFLRTAAFGQANLANVVTFGDSLTHNDMLGLFSGSPQDMYGADPMEAVFNKGAAPEDHLARYAIGGSQSDQITLQIGLYQVNRRFGRQDSATLFNLEIGGNDILDHIKLLASSAPGTNPSADAVINNLIENILKDLLYLRKIDQQAQFVLWTVPDVLLTPMLWDSFDSTEMDNIRAHAPKRCQTLTFDLDMVMRMMFKKENSFVTCQGLTH
jgi:lysophospholipase L1-like esterase